MVHVISATRRLPDFLIIGAMKAGTTTLWGDLRSHPEVYLPQEKEPGNLRSDSVLDLDGTRRYARLFGRAIPKQICGEASTYYTMLPEIKGVPQRAEALCGPNLKIIYMVRNPIKRALSHHYHSVVAGDMAADINEAVVRDARLINYGRYAMQLEPWLEVFGKSNIHVIKMEDFFTHRQPKLEQLCRFLGIQPCPQVIAHSQRALNTRDDLVRLGGLTKSISGSVFYRRLFRPLLPQAIRNGVKKAWGRVPQGYSAAPSWRTLELLAEGVRDDCLRLAELLGVRELWDLDATVAELCGESHRSSSKATTAYD